MTHHTRSVRLQRQQFTDSLYVQAQAADAMATWCRSVAVVIFSSSRGRPVISARPSGSNASCRRCDAR
eukprot:symbB.v1.2.016511.t1/scaffold1211.1/size131413/9